jgi:hypothetical protein
MAQKKCKICWTYGYRWMPIISDEGIDVGDINWYMNCPEITIRV